MRMTEQEKKLRKFALYDVEYIGMEEPEQENTWGIIGLPVGALIAIATWFCVVVVIAAWAWPF